MNQLKKGLLTLLTGSNLLDLKTILLMKILLKQRKTLIMMLLTKLNIIVVSRPFMMDGVLQYGI